ncbi:MAG: glutamate racemase [Polyangiales bacterium]
MTESSTDERSTDERSTDERPIGVFDSGLGGLTVVRAIREHLPNENIVYLGDTARVPYGTRSAQTVVRYARSCARALAAHDPKLLVVACNTVSAVALDMLRVELDIPVLGVISPGARAGVEASKTGRIAVIATAGTVASGAYGRAIAAIDSRIELRSLAAPLLVPLAEEGWLEGEVPERVIERYLSPLAGSGVDALILGCTHYPLFRGLIEGVGHRVAGPELVVADSAEATALELASLLESRDMAGSGPGSLEVMVTDLPARFTAVAARFLGAEVPDVRSIDL